MPVEARGVGSSGAAVTGRGDPPCGCWEGNSGSLQGAVSG